MRRCILLFAVLFCTLSCTSPLIKKEQKLTVGGEEKALYYTMQNLLIKDAQGKRVYSGTANIYQNKITYTDFMGNYHTIPSSEIHTVYGKYRGGGFVSSLIFLGWFSIQFNRLATSDSYLAGYAMFAALEFGAYALPASAILGSVVGNFNLELYKASNDTSSTPNYFSIADNLPESRSRARVKARLARQKSREKAREEFKSK